MSIGLRLARAAAPHDRAHPRDELARRERLDDVVVGAELETDDAVDLLAARREHDDRNVGRLADLPGEVSAVAVGEHHVEQHEVGLFARRPRAPAIVGVTSASNPSRARCSASGSEILASSSTRSTRGFMPTMVLVTSRLPAARTTPRRQAPWDLDLSFLTEESPCPQEMQLEAEGGHMSATLPLAREKLIAAHPRERLRLSGGSYWGLWFLNLHDHCLRRLVPLRVTGFSTRDGAYLLDRVVAAVGAASLPFESGQSLGLDMPVLLSVGYLFGPIVGGAMAFVAYVDPRELRGEIPFVKGFFNRAQTSLSVMAATGIFLVVVRGGHGWPVALLAAFLAVGTDCLVNYGTVVGVLCLHERIRPLDGFSRLYFGSLPEFALTYASFGLLSLMLAEVFKSVGVWSLLVFVIPVLLARQAFVGNRDWLPGRRLDVQAEALRDVASSMADERREERLSLAAGLHDEVLPPLFRVHFMGQVLRQDLASGRLLALEEDLPALLGATEAASESPAQPDSEPQGFTSWRRRVGD